MPSRMKRDNVRNLCLPCCQHRQWWHKCMTALAMDEVPSSMFDQGIDLWRNIIVALRRPCLHANDTHSFVLGLSGKPVETIFWLGRQQCDANSTAYQASSDFVHMRLDSPHIREIARSY